MVQTDPKTEPHPPHPTAKTDIPETPALAPNVELSGEMQDGAYEQQQWLVRRNGDFVQITELLYRVAEQLDGKRSIDEIAQGVSDAIDRRVSADNVRQLLGSKLIPLGLVAKADGSVVEQTRRDGSAASRSPLQINMRVRALSPRFINPFTAVLQKLFWPPILIVLLVVAAAAQVYVFVIHGIASSVHDVLYHPALMFVLLGTIIVGTIWHEFGHASALTYGGGEVRGMGAGIYLVYPAFYTDVTDNYRLPRWSKVRTDLGGFYFNLIFAAGMVGLYFLTHLAWLLLVVLLIDLEIFQQILPFGRYDGYWTLADITGVPDFFSRIPGFVKSMLPFVRGGDAEFSKYKGWVRVVFALYVIVTVPVMAFIFFMMIKNAPRVLATGWDSAHTQLNALSTAHAHGHTVDMALAVAQLIILALPTFGMIYIFVNLARRGGKALWNYSKPTPGRRIKGGLITIGIAAFLGYLWVPQLPLGGGRSGPWAVQAAWTPISPHERGTLGDAGASLAQVPVPYNPFRRAAVLGGTVSKPPSPAPVSPVKATATARAVATTRAVTTAKAVATAKASATPQTSPTPQSTPTVQPGGSANPTAQLATVPPTVASTQPAGVQAPPPPPPPTYAPTYAPTVLPTPTP